MKAFFKNIQWKPTWDANTVRRTNIDYRLLTAVVLLTGLGLTMVFSSSAVLAQEKFGDSLFFLKKTIFFVLFGFGFMILISRVPYFYWRRFVYPLFFGCLLLNILTLFPGFGIRVGGATRWIQLGSFTFQPSELARLVVIVFMAYSLEKKDSKMEVFPIGVLSHILIVGTLLLFILVGKDLGSTFVVGALVFSLLFLGGARLKHLLLLCLATLPFLYFLIAHEGYRLRRILAFLNPWEDRLGSGFQIIQSFLAFNEGGLLGKGLGAGKQKLFYLPEAHTDFIFSVLGEELGLIGVLFTIGLFVFLVTRCIQIAKKAPDLFGFYLALGVGVLIALQSLLNMGVVLGLLPTKGLVLPFLGYGGSALITTLGMMGIVLSVSTYQKTQAPPLFTRGGR